MADDKLEADDVGTGEETKIERVVSNFLGVTIHLFLSALAVLLLIGAGIAAFDTVVRDFPVLLSPAADEYVALQKIIENLLLIAIAAEFAFLLLFHRISAAVEVMVFVIARKTVNHDITALDLLLCTAAIAGLIVLKFYYVPGKTT
ncbi:MAG TPA: hypothetical protein PKY82_29270 [Pyrinomonadaceae bacterium]|nr:hypothetical protein [Pyrinomonadaceae bacterium]